MIVDIDIGNTRAKYRVKNVARSTAISCSHAELPAAILSLAPERDACLVRVASVADKELTRQLEIALAIKSNVRLIKINSSGYCAGVTSSYVEPQRLGVDRWLAMIGAFHRFSAPCIVIDAGSAVTLDLVDERGFHQGGWICPGLAMMRSSLLQGTAGVRFEQPDEMGVVLGRSTAEAVYNGTLAMMVGWLNSSVTALLEKYRNAHIVLSGGDAGELRSCLNFAFTAWPDIVLDAMALVPGDQ